MTRWVLEGKLVLRHGSELTERTSCFLNQCLVKRYISNVVVQVPSHDPTQLRQNKFDGYAMDYIDVPQGMEWFLKKEINLHRTVRRFNLPNWLGYPYLLYQ